MLDQDLDGRFATAILARIGLGGDGISVTIAAAGHPAALVSRGAGRAEEFGELGTLLGVFSDPVIEEASTILAPGDSLALYTDGLSEALAPDSTLSPEDMTRQLERASSRSAQGTIDALIGLIDLDGGARDDIAILAARVMRLEEP